VKRGLLVERFRSLADDLEDVDRCLRAGHPAVLINDWAIMERAVPGLVERTLGHPTVADGEVYYLDNHRSVARTLSRWYALGPSATADPQFQ